MAINFPNNPALNETYSNGTTTWKWNGSVWELSQNTNVSFNRITAERADIADLNVITSVSGISFDQLDDVQLTGLQNNQTLAWNTGLLKWTNVDSFNGGTITDALTIQNTLTVQNTLTTSSNVELRQGGELRLFNTVDSTYIGFAAPPNPTQNKIYTLPRFDGASGQVLRTDGSGNLSWVSIVSPSGGTPAQGPEGAIQYNDGLEFAGVSTMTFDADEDRLTVPRLTATGPITVSNVTESSSSNSGAMVVGGGAGIAKNLSVSGSVRFYKDTGSVSTVTGALVVDGGVGIAENVYVGGIVDSDDVPTEASHLTNKQYVDNRVTAFAVAFGA